MQFNNLRKHLQEKTLTTAEKKKREEVAKAIERDNPNMPMGMKMAIATKTAKRVAEAKETSYTGKGNHRPGWMLKADPELAKKFKEKEETHKARVKAYGNPLAGKSVKEEVVDESKSTASKPYYRIVSTISPELKKRLTAADEKRRENARQLMQRPTKPTSEESQKEEVEGVAEEVESIDEISKELANRVSTARRKQADASSAKDPYLKPSAETIAKKKKADQAHSSWIKRMFRDNNRGKTQADISRDHAAVADQNYKRGWSNEEVEIDEDQIDEVSSKMALNAYQAANEKSVKEPTFARVQARRAQAKRLLGKFQEKSKKEREAPMKEEVENIEELKKSTIGNYMSKTVDPVYGMPKPTQKLKQRLAGMSRAHQRIIGKKPTTEN